MGVVVRMGLIRSSSRSGANLIKRKGIHMNTQLMQLTLKDHWSDQDWQEYQSLVRPRKPSKSKQRLPRASPGVDDLIAVLMTPNEEIRNRAVKAVLLSGFTPESSSSVCNPLLN